MPLIHALRKPNPVLESLFQQRKRTGTMSLEMKYLALDELKEQGSLVYTLNVLKTLQSALMDQLELLESEAGGGNRALWQMLLKLRIE